MQATRLLIGGVLVLGLAASSPAPAQPAPPSAIASSPITPAPSAPVGQVGRVSLVVGAVDLHTSGAWHAALPNDPIAPDISVRTGAAGLAELRIGRDTIELAGDSVLDIVRLDASVVELKLTSGRIGIDLSRLAAAERVEIDVPRGGIWLEAAGHYDIAAGSATSASRIAVAQGEARFVGAHADLTIPAGRLALLNGADPIVTTEAPIEAPASPDSFLAWWQARAAAAAGTAAPAHVPAAMTGAETLAAAGRWEDDGGAIGWVWYPRGVAADWVPYRFGRWSWIRPWGWTWIADAAWGFAPSHYGRWVRIEQRWGWVPGDLGAHPAFAPAVVAFLGTQGVGLSFAEGNGPAIGWFPLAPGEAYWPSYSDDPAAIRRLNAPALHDLAILATGSDGRPPVAVVDGHYANRRFATVVPRPVFAGGHAVQEALLSLPEERLEEAPLVIGAPPIPPPAPPRLILAQKPARPEKEHAAETHKPEGHNKPEGHKPEPHTADARSAAEMPVPPHRPGLAHAGLAHAGLAHAEVAHAGRLAVVPAVARSIPHRAEHAVTPTLRPPLTGHDRLVRVDGAPLHGPALVRPERPRAPHAIDRVKTSVPPRTTKADMRATPQNHGQKRLAPRHARAPAITHRIERGRPRLAAAKDYRQ